MQRSVAWASLASRRPDGCRESDGAADPEEDAAPDAGPDHREREVVVLRRDQTDLDKKFGVNKIWILGGSCGGSVGRAVASCGSNPIGDINEQYSTNCISESIF